jgi:hypothetical protein
LLNFPWPARQSTANSMATFSVPWADAPARPAMVDLQHNSLIIS